MCVIGPGVAVHPGLLVAELDELGAREIDTSGLRVSTAAHLVMPYHQSLDRAEDDAREERRLGTTGRGIGPTYVDKARRIGLRVGDLLDETVFREKLQFVLDRKYHELAAVGIARPDADAIADEYLQLAQRLLPFIAETQPLVDEAVGRGRQVLLEGAHATLLDLDHGTYPYVTSSHCTVAGLLQGSGVGPRRLTRAIGVFKAYCSRVGEGPFPTELFDETADRIREIGHEYGTTTGRPAPPRLVRRRGQPPLVARQRVRRHRPDPPGHPDRLRRAARVHRLRGRRPARSTISRARSRRWRAAEPIYETFPGWNEPLDGRTRLGRPARQRAGLRPPPGGAARSAVQLIGVGEARDEIVQL